MNYADFLDKKTQLADGSGFEPLWMPDFLFDVQSYLVDWAIRAGRSAVIADCGMGKTPMLLVYAENVVRKTNGNMLILDPLAVTAQTAREAEKFGVEATRSSDGKIKSKITITNYERLDRFDPNDFVGVVCDESSILKSFDGIRRSQITDFMRKIPYRLLTTATAAPNDYIELGTSSEALGNLGYMDMLNRFFRNDNNNSATRRMHGEAPKWRFKGHAQEPFWRWVASWARACRKPSDLGFSDDRFILPPLNVQRHVLTAKKLADGMLFNLPAHGLREQRDERNRSIEDRCEKAAELIHARQGPSIAWCNLNAEGDLLEELLPQSVQISGSDSDEAKEEKFLAFISGQARDLVIKPKIGAWGLNFQHCSHVAAFPTHSYEQYYQAVRRCWRFGQTSQVDVDIVMTKGDEMVMQNLGLKSVKADQMFERLVREMNNAVKINRQTQHTLEMETPSWL